MRSLTLLVLSLAVVSVGHGQPFPVPLTAPRAVQDVILAGAAGTQSNPHVATNGDVALVVWQDVRDGSSAIYAARVDTGGNVLDPLGVRIGDGTDISTVAWNGASFVVVFGRTFVFISPDMAITATKEIDLPYTYIFATVTSGSDVRFLFLAWTLRSGNVAIVDEAGRVVSRTPLWTVPASWIDRAVVAGGSDSGFLLLHELVEIMGQRHRIIAERIDGNGKALSSTDAALPYSLNGYEAISGGSDGFLLIGQSRGDVAAYALDAAGGYLGRTTTLAIGSADVRYAPYRPAVVREDGRYVAVWYTLQSSGSSQEWVSEITVEGSVTVRLMNEWRGITSDIGLTSYRGARFVASAVDRGLATDFDVFAASLSPSLVRGKPRLVAASGTAHSNVEIAAGANGYAVTWVEAGPDASVHGYVRRFSPAGVPQDAAPLPVLTLPYAPAAMYLTRARIASNGETYVLGWQTTSGFVIRRLDARTGLWLDSQPVLLPGHGTADLASNGTDALAVSIGKCRTRTERCVVATRIPMSSEPPGGPVVSVPAALKSVDPTVASNGSDYLVAWSDPAFCDFPCPGIPSQVYAVRLRGDGSALDSAPLLLDNGKRFPQRPTVAWSGGGYLVVWLDLGARATRVTTEGAVLDRDAAGGGILLARSDLDGPFVQIARAMALDGRFALLTGTSSLVPNPFPRRLTWEGVAFSADADLATVASMPRTTVLTMPSQPYPTLAAVARDRILGVAYSRTGDQSAGGVSRAFVQIFGPPTPRRRVVER